MNQAIIMIMMLLTVTSKAAVNPFRAIPPTLVIQYQNLKKLKTPKARQQAFDTLHLELQNLEKDLFKNPDVERPYDSLVVFELKELFKNIKSQGFTAKGCASSLKLLPHWADPKLKKIEEASESARFSHAVTSAVCALK